MLTAEQVAGHIIHNLAPKGVWDCTHGEVANYLHEWKESIVDAQAAEIKRLNVTIEMMGKVDEKDWPGPHHLTDEELHIALKGMYDFPDAVILEAKKHQWYSALTYHFWKIQELRRERELGYKAAELYHQCIQTLESKLGAAVEVLNSVAVGSYAQRHKDDGETYLVKTGWAIQAGNVLKNITEAAKAHDKRVRDEERERIKKKIRHRFDNVQKSGDYDDHAHGEQYALERLLDDIENEELGKC